MKAVVLDFETYFDDAYSLERMTVPEYVHDPRFRVHGLAVREIDDGAGFHADVVGTVASLQKRYGANLEAVPVIFHNSYFDYYVLYHKFGVRVAHLVDTMLLAHQVWGRKSKIGGSGASLEAVAAKLKLPVKGNLKFMKGVREPNWSERSELEKYAKNDVDLTYQIASILLPQIDNPGIELPLMQHTVRLFVERGIRVDMAEIERLESPINSDLKDIVGATGATEVEISSNKLFKEILCSAMASSGRSIPMKPGKRGPIPATARNDHEMHGLLNDADSRVAGLVRARIAKKSSDQTLSRLGTLKRIVSATRGALPVHLHYYGCHTGRWSGGGGFNIQNIGRSGIGHSIRQLFRATPGKVFVIGDFAQIEARVLAWLAGQLDLVEAFATGRDVYSEFAAHVFCREVRKPLAGDSPEVSTRLKSDRHIGKQAVLGLGYSMGALRFHEMLKADPVGVDCIEMGVINPGICKAIVTQYRQLYPRIVDFWATCEACFKRAMNGARADTGALQFVGFVGGIKICLPSGRSIKYHNVGIRNQSRAIQYLDDFGSVREFVPEAAQIVHGNESALYGGKIVENIVQGVARDLLGEAILRLEQRGLRVAFHVHDEIVIEVPKDQIAQALLIVKDEMARCPAWASGLPLACEVVESGRYTK